MGAIGSMRPVILFDGVCNLCNSTVLFIIKNDKSSRFAFASLQSTFGQSILAKYELPLSDLNTVLFLNEDQLFTKSNAALEIAKWLDGGWPVLYIFKVIPSGVRNLVYDWVARNRYRWFGKRDVCMIPTPDLKARFIDN
jgi:predicted DCC family thiol-disulfide oxidoreductase YuxK